MTTCSLLSPTFTRKNGPYGNRSTNINEFSGMSPRSHSPVRSHGTMSRLRQIWNTAFGCLSDHDYNREVHIPRCFLGILGIWSEPEPMSRLKCALSATLLTFFNFLPRFLGLFNIANDRLFFYHLGSVAYRLYIIVVILLLHFNFKIRRSIVEEMGDNWRTTQALEDKKVMRRYADYSRKISWIIIAAFAATFVITWLSLLLGLATGQMELHAALSALSFQSQPLVDALGIIFVTIASFISLLPAMGTETFFAVCVCHTCGQLALLKNRIAAYEGVTRHQFEQDTPGMCSCLKCIVDSHVKICDFVATIDNHFHVVLFFRLVAGVVGVVCGGFEVSKVRIHNNK
ncbi:uncharacterized protein LOC135169165 [Diachasmimorpha longicaudata]|uniref:uncharacterized protein LOC135169165 n=1 Tax=Diachasmimorpha longicaudata TaxID=58733 RepID=UPI0030B8D8A4